MNTQQTTELDFVECVKQAHDDAKPLHIIGNNTKAFMGHDVEAESLSLSSYKGIIAYEPTELYITAKAGTPIQDINTHLAESNQMLAFEPPDYQANSSVGGVVASGISGSRRPYAGSVRDFVLGIKCINGKGEALKFGGQVIKNVAGYDVSRLVTGSYGTLAVMLEVTLRVSPKPEREYSISFPQEFSVAQQSLHEWMADSVPITAAACSDGRLNIRLSGKSQSVESSLAKFVTDFEPLTNDYWHQLDAHKLGFFSSEGQSLWRLSLPMMTPQLNLEGEWLIDWGGAQRWFKTQLPADVVRSEVESYGGHATLIRATQETAEPFHPLPDTLKILHQKIKHSFDPKRILNPGRMYADI